jgi:hypothetical protein
MLNTICIARPSLLLVYVCRPTAPNLPYKMIPGFNQGRRTTSRSTDLLSARRNWLLGVGYASFPQSTLHCAKHQCQGETQQSSPSAPRPGHLTGAPNSQRNQRATQQSSPSAPRPGHLTGAPTRRGTRELSGSQCLCSYQRYQTDPTKGQNRRSFDIQRTRPRRCLLQR